MGRAAGWPFRSLGRSGPSAGPDRATDRPPNDIHDLVDVLVGVALLGGGPDAALHVILEDEERYGIHRGPKRGRLLKDVDAVLLTLDHPGDPPHLTLDTTQAPEQLRSILRVAVAERPVIVPAGIVHADGRGILAGAGRHVCMILPMGIRVIPGFGAAAPPLDR
jgi:hypothetical protein